ncbi:sodium:solute symporter family transporter [Neisseria meningitidis]|uniref:sodium:solute symporter family transporter n=1 Tax=Neisseria meningitidis TaxID=487 RepID=UPI002A188AC5|nr:hypothetical protein [Neisseria meningitidis]
MNPMYITFAIYLVAVLLIGLAAYFSTRNFDDYILGGRSLGPFVTAMSAGASDMSGWLLMGLPGAIYLSGLNEAWIAIGLLVGNCLSIECLDSRLRGNDGILGFCNLGQLSVIVLTQRHHFNLLHRPAQKTLADGSEFQRNIADVKTVVGIVVVGIEQSFLSKDACGFFGRCNCRINQRDIARLPAD